MASMTYAITDEAGKVINTIVASAEFVEEAYKGRYTLLETDNDTGAQQALDDAKATRKAAIKVEAAALIAATDWKLERARERETAGWAGLADVDAVLAEREAIRQSSSAAEAAVDALTDAAAIQSFTWAVDVPVKPPRRLTLRLFMERFTEQEQAAILAAAETTPAVKTWWTRFQISLGINLDDPATTTGVEALEALKLIGKGRAKQILA